MTILTAGAMLTFNVTLNADDHYEQFVNGASVADSFSAFSNNLADLEEVVAEQGEEIDELKSALKKKVNPGNSKSTMKVSGRIHADYWAFPEHDDVIEGLEKGNPQDRFGFRRMRFGVAGKLPANMLYKIEMEFAGGNKSEFRDAYLGWDDLPYVQTLLLGNQKRPYSLDHLNSSRYNVFLERPFVIEAFNQDSRRFGLCSYGDSDDLAWNWRYGVYNTNLIQADCQAINDHYQLEFAGRLANTYWYDECSDGRGYGHWAIAGTHAEVDGGSDETRFLHRPEARSSSKWLSTGTVADADNYNLIGAEAVLNLGALQVVAEYQSLWLQRDAGDTVNYHGGYIYAAYFLTGEHMPWDRESGTLDRIKPFEDFFLVKTCNGGIGRGWGAWQVAARWSYADFGESVGVGTQLPASQFGVEGEALTVGLNWYWTQCARLQFNWLHGEITTAAATTGDYDIVGARFMVDF